MGVPRLRLHPARVEVPEPHRLDQVAGLHRQHHPAGDHGQLGAQPEVGEQPGAGPATWARPVPARSPAPSAPVACPAPSCPLCPTLRDRYALGRAGVAAGRGRGLSASPGVPRRKAAFRGLTDAPGCVEGYNTAGRALDTAGQRRQGAT
jgi:hypothetical protein